MIILNALLVIAINTDAIAQGLFTQRSHELDSNRGGSEAIWINPSRSQAWGIPYNDRVIYTNPDFGTSIAIDLDQHFRAQAREAQAKRDLGNLLLQQAIERGVRK